MGFLKGTAAFVRFSVEGDLPENIWDFIAERIEGNNEIPRAGNSIANIFRTRKKIKTVFAFKRVAESDGRFSARFFEEKIKTPPGAYGVTVRALGKEN